MATVLDKVTCNNGNPVYTPFPTPVEVSYTLSTMDASSSGRNQSGLMFRDVIANKVKTNGESDNITAVTALIK